MTTPTAVNMTKLAADIAGGVGTEFPAPPGEMPGRQYLSLVEEAEELDQALADGNLHELRGELADTLVTVYLLAHYLPEVDLIRELAYWSGSWETLRSPSFYAVRLAKPLRRALGYARTPGGWAQVAIKLAHVELAVRTAATKAGVNLELAVADKTQVIFTRGWRATAPVTDEVTTIAGHGHVNPERLVARCGGPALCSACAVERCRRCGSVGSQSHAEGCVNARPSAEHAAAHSYKCAGCGNPIVGDVWLHNRLGVHLHGSPVCHGDVRGENVGGHCLTWVTEVKA